MARLPDLDSLGGRPTPRPALSVASVRNPDAISNAVGRFGDTASDIGGDIIKREDELGYAAAKANLLKEDALARQELADDPDFETAEKRYTERMTKARTNAGTLIKSNFDRRIFEVDTASDLDRGTFEVRKQVEIKRKAAKTGLFASSLEDSIASARNLSDDASREAAITNVSTLIQGAQDQGLLDPVKAVDLRRETTDRIIAGQAYGALDRGDIEGARQIVEKYGKFIGDENFYKLRAAMQDEGDAQSVMRAVDAGFKPIVAGTSEVPSLVTSLFPGARVTDTDRAPNSALGRANPNSHHVVRPGKGTKGIDVAPIPGVTFEQYVDTLKANGVDIVEARDEVKNPSKHATGPHWHIGYRVKPSDKPATLEETISRSVAALGPNATVKQIKEVRAEAAARWQVQEAAERDNEDAAVERVQEALRQNGGNWYALPPSLRRSVKAKYTPGLIDFADGLKPSSAKRETDPNEYVRLTTMAATNPKAFAALNPIEYRSKFSDGDWEKLVGERARILGKPEGDAGGASISEIRSVTAPMLAARGLSDVGVKKPADRAAINARVYGFERAIATDVAVWQQNNPGKKPTTRDIQEMADRRLLTAIQNDNERFQFELAPGPAKIRIPAAARARVASEGRRILGREPTEQEILQAYLNEARIGA